MTIHIAVRALAVAGLAGLLALYFAFGMGAQPAHAQLPDLDDILDPDLDDPDLDDPDLDDPDVDDPDVDDGDLLGDLLDLGLLADLLDMDEADLLDLDLDELLDLLDLDSLLDLLDLLDLLADPDPEPTPDPVTPAPTPAPAAPGAPQVTERPVGGVATGAGGASEHSGSGPAPFLLGSMVLAGAGSVLARRFTSS